MCRPCINVVLACIFMPSLCLGQFGSLREESAFLRHLQQEKLYRESMFVLQHLPDDSDINEISLEKAWTFHALDSYDSALRYYRRVPYDTISHYGYHHNYLSLLLKRWKIDTLENILSLYPLEDAQARKKFKNSLDLLSLQYDLDRAVNDQLPQSILYHYKEYNKVEHKSGFLATTFSMLLPGSGKFYYGQRRQAWNMFFANFALGIQTYESLRKAGVSSARFIIFGSLFSVFYISNIYGTIAGLKKARRDRRQQLQYEIIDAFFMDGDVHPASRR